MKRILLYLPLPFLLASCHHDPFPVKTADVIYVETNNYYTNENSVLAYLHFADGTTQPLPGSPFYTGGTGLANPTQMLGFDDEDKQLKISADGHFLLAVNPGSNTIAVFHIDIEGGLSPVPGSPFPSYGTTPASIDVRDNDVYVVNKAQAPAGVTSTIKPNYTMFTIDAEGTLTHVPNSTVETTPGTSPSQVLVSNSGKFVFGDDWLGFMNTPAVGTLRSFTRDNTGKITPVAGTPYTIPAAGGALGLWQHPYDNVLYVGFALAGKVGVYDVDETTGALTFKTSLPAGLAACWLRINYAGDRLYVLNSGENTVSMYNTSTADAPVSMGKFILSDPGPDYQALGLTFTTSEPFSEEFSSNEKSLYVLDQYTNPAFNVGNFNKLHILGINADGTLSETAAPVTLPIDNHFRPWGIAVHQVQVYTVTATGSKQ